MATIRLKNITSGYAKVGQLVRISPTNPNAFQYVTDLTKLDVIGTIATAGSPGSLCTINLMNAGGASSWDELTGKPTIPKITISAIAPNNPSVNDIWISTI